jgi:uncharacterized membrane protein
MYSGPPPNVSSSSSDDGDNSNVVAGLCYLVGLVAVILFFTERRNFYIKFHAAQALLIHLAAIVSTLIWLLIFLAIIVSGLAASVGTSSSGLAAGVAALAVLVISLLGFGLFFLYLAALIWGMIAAFTWKSTKLPLVGELAERWASEMMPLPSR